MSAPNTTKLLKFLQRTFFFAIIFSCLADLIPVYGDCVSPPNGLIAWWPGDGNAIDLVGGNDGTLVGGVTYTNGEVGDAFSFNGSDYVQVPNGELWNFGASDFSIEFWANFSASGTAETFIADDDGQNEVPKWAFWWRNGTVLSFHINGNGVYGGNQIGNVPFTPTFGQWYHIAVTRSGSTYTFYVNGASVGTGSDSESIPYITAPLTIGMAEGLFYFNGQLDEVSIYNRALLPSEIAAIYNAGNDGKCVSITITNQPANVSVSTGGTAKFCVGVTGLSPISFQWAWNGTNINGATNCSLTLTNVSAANVGVYTVTATNSSSSATSANATLTTVDIKLFAGVVINGVIGTNYTIQSTSNLQSSVWDTLTNVVLYSNPYTYIDYSSISNSMFFYSAFDSP